MVPKEINKNVVALLSTINSIESPCYIKVEPETYASINNFFPSVNAKIEKDGGKILYGWQIWQSKNLIEAEFHGIWESEDGVRIDITPKAIPGIESILFLPDSRMTYQGTQVNNIRVNITTNALVDDFIKLWDTKFILENKGERAYKNRLVKSDFSPAEQVIYPNVITTLNGIKVMLEKSQDRSSKCFCNSNLKYKQCHGKILLELRNM